MIKPIVLIIAESVVRDAKTNRISIFNIHENFPTIGFPLLIPKFTIFAMLERQNEDPQTPSCQLRIRLDDDVLFDMPIEINFGSGLITRAIGEFQGFVLPHPGTLQVTIEIAGQSMSSYRVPVSSASTQPPVISNV